jgi:hypothetical protein
VTSLFTVQTPASTDNSDGTPGITTATTVRFAAVGEVSGNRFFATDTVGGTYTVALWEVTAADPNGSGGTLLASKTMPGAPTGGAWNTVLFDTPVAVTTGKLYRAGVFSGDGRYVFTAAFFGSDLVNGDITADANGDDPVGLGNLNQGSFTINAAIAYPTSQPGSTCYFVDVVYTADGGTTTVTSDLDVRRAVRSAVTSDLDVRRAVRAAVVSDLDIRRAVRAAVTSDLDLRRGVGGVVTSDLDLRRQVEGTAVPSGRAAAGWWSYGAALRFNADQARIEADRPPVGCPYCGEALQIVGDMRHCPSGDYLWPKGAQAVR